MTDRAVSPVVGVVLMTAIVVVLAGVVATLVVGFENELQEPAPNGGFEQDYVSSGEDNTNDRPYLVIEHQVGRTVDAENVIIKDEAGNRITWESVWTGGPEVKANEYVHIDGFGSDSPLEPICREGQSYWVILQDDRGNTLMINKWTAPSDPTLPPGSPSDSNGDGIPDWC